MYLTLPVKEERVNIRFSNYMFKLYIMNSADYYSVLGCNKESTYEDVKRAYHALALQFHPDKNVSEVDREKFQRILEAWNVLRNPKLREEYDIVKRQAELDSNSALIYARISVDELESIDENRDTFVYHCRCGGLYYVEKEYLSEKHRTVHVPCVECTFLIVVET